MITLLSSKFGPKPWSVRLHGGEHDGHTLEYNGKLGGTVAVSVAESTSVGAETSYRIAVYQVLPWANGTVRGEYLYAERIYPLRRPPETVRLD